MTGRQSAAAAAEVVESLGRPLKAPRVSGGGEPRLSESFSMFIHPTLLLFLVQQPTPPASFCIQMQTTLTNPYPLTTHLSHFPFHHRICQFFPTSLYLPFQFTSSHPPPGCYLSFLSLPEFCICQSLRTSPFLHSKLLFPLPTPPSCPSQPAEQHIQYINLHTTLWVSPVDNSFTGSSCHSEETVSRTPFHSEWLVRSLNSARGFSPLARGPGGGPGL